MPDGPGIRGVRHPPRHQEQHKNTNTMSTFLKVLLAFFITLAVVSAVVLLWTLIGEWVFAIIFFALGVFAVYRVIDLCDD